jgi:hypothetical protein
MPFYLGTNIKVNSHELSKLERLRPECLETASLNRRFVDPSTALDLASRVQAPLRMTVGWYED